LPKYTGGRFPVWLGESYLKLVIYIKSTQHSNPNNDSNRYSIPENSEAILKYVLSPSNFSKLGSTFLFNIKNNEYELGTHLLFSSSNFWVGIKVNSDIITFFGHKKTPIRWGFNYNIFLLKIQIILFL